MTFKSISVLLVAFAANICIPVCAQTDWNSENILAKKALEHSDYTKAKGHFKQALLLAKAGNVPDSKQVLILIDLAKISFLQEKKKEGEDYTNRAITLVKKYQNTNDPEYANYYSRIGQLYQQQERYEEAIANLQNAIRLREDLHQITDADYISDINNLGLSYLQQGSISESERILLKALELAEKNIGFESSNLCVILNNLGLHYSSKLKYQEAESLFQRAISVGKSKNSNQLLVATTMENLADIYSKQGKWEQARLTQQEALKNYEKQPILIKEKLSGFLVKMAYFCGKTGKYTDAELLYKKALKIDEKSKVSKDLRLARDLNDLGILYFDQKKYLKALSFHKRALEKMENAVGPTNSELYSYLLNCANVLEILNRKKESDLMTYRAAAILMTPAIGSCEKIEPSKDPSLNLLLTDYINLLKKAHRFKDASLAEAKLKKSRKP